MLCHVVRHNALRKDHVAFLSVLWEMHNDESRKDFLYIIIHFLKVQDVGLVLGLGKVGQ